MQLAAAQSVTAAMGFDLQGFLLWTAVNFGLWGIVSGMSCLGNNFQARSVRDMNNDLRHDL